MTHRFTFTVMPQPRDPGYGSAGGLPRPGRLVVNLPDNHLQYALTWFGLAAVLAGVFVAWAFSSRNPTPRNGETWPR